MAVVGQLSSCNTQQGQADVCHLGRPESGQVRTRGRTRLNRFLVGLFFFELNYSASRPKVGCFFPSHVVIVILTLTIFVLVYPISRLMLEPRSHADVVEYLYRL